MAEDAEKSVEEGGEGGSEKIDFQLGLAEIEEQYEDLKVREKETRDVEEKEVKEDEQRAVGIYEQILQDSVFKDFEKEDHQPTDDDLLDFACSGMIDLNDTIDWNADLVEKFVGELEKGPGTEPVNLEGVLRDSLKEAWDFSKEMHLKELASEKAEKEEHGEKKDDEEGEKKDEKPPTKEKGSETEDSDEKESKKGFFDKLSAGFSKGIDAINGVLINGLLNEIGNYKENPDVMLDMNSLWFNARIAMVTSFLGLGSESPKWANDLLEKGDSIELHNLKALGITFETKQVDGINKVSKINVDEMGEGIPTQTGKLFGRVFGKDRAVDFFTSMNKETTLTEFRADMIPKMNPKEQTVANQMVSIMEEIGADPDKSMVNFLEEKSIRVPKIVDELRKTTEGKEALAVLEPTPAKTE